MPAAPDIVRQLLRRADRHTVAAVLAAVSVDADRERARLSMHRKAVAGVPRHGEVPRLEDLDATAAWIVDQTSGQASMLGGVAGLAGVLSVPPEVLAFLVGMVRMGQRVGVVYGFEPHTDRGRMALQRALAAAFEVELPERGLLDLRVTDVASLVWTRTPGKEQVGQQLATGLVLRSARAAVGRWGRLLPVVASSAAASGNHRRTHEVGARMIAVYRRLCDAAGPSVEVEEAVEVGR